MAANTKAYSGTAVPVSKSQDELRRLLVKFGAEQFTFGEGRDWAGVEFVHASQLVRLRCPVRLVTEDDIRAEAAVLKRAVAVVGEQAQEKERARVWRVLVWSVKARLVAVEEGLESFEQAFLSHLVDPVSDQTMWQAVREPIESGAFKLGGPGLRALGPGR